MNNVRSNENVSVSEQGRKIQLNINTLKQLTGNDQANSAEALNANGNGRTTETLTKPTGMNCGFTCSTHG